MGYIKLRIHGIKNIADGEMEFPIENGVYCIAGANGSGKSTIMSCLAQTIFRSSLSNLRDGDFSLDAFVEIDNEKSVNKWVYNEKCQKWGLDKESLEQIRYNGLYEGSLFYGTRFADSLTIDGLVQEGKINANDIADSDDYIKEKLSYILHGDELHYTMLKRVRNKNIAKSLALKNTPYFNNFNNRLVSQYRMSSGECLLISLLHFIYNSLIRRSLPVTEPILMLIDEIELALHPVAVSRFIDLLNELVKEHPTLTVILTSHSPEVIRKISHNNLFMLEHDDSNDSIIVTNPCYPSYAIRDVYVHDGYDYVILVEDLLAKYVVEAVIKRLNLNESRLINILPVGGWENVLKLQHQLYISNAFGVGTQIFSILDGDVKNNIPRYYSVYTHSYLPISSVEKYLYKIIAKRTDQIIKKKINDTFFSVQSLDNLLADYYSKDCDEDRNGKKLYKLLVGNLTKREITEEVFVKELCNIILQYQNFDTLEKFLAEHLSITK